MNLEKKKEILNMLIEIQKQSAPIVVSIGAVLDGHIDHDSIIIKECPPVVLKKLMEIDGVFPDVSNNGVLVL